MADDDRGGDGAGQTRRAILWAAGAWALACAVPARVQAQNPPASGRRSRMNAFEFEFKSIDGEALPMRQFAGRPVLLVNTASFCGFTPQYKDLEAVWDRYRARGLVVLGVPSNDFGGQEPGSSKEIKAFCESYDVTFPLTEKQRVVGPLAHPLYQWIERELGEAGTPRWNFHKYLIARDGQIAAVWSSEVVPTSREVSAALEKALQN